MSDSQQCVEAAVRWWKSKRPVAWTPDQHYDNPLVNLVSEQERELGAAASLCAEEMEER